MKLFVIIAFLLCSAYGLAQKGYSKDSLQVKLYADIKYENKQTKSIEIRKIFCDYCNEAQLKLIKEEGWRRAYQGRNLSVNRLTEGTRKLTIIIRFAKEDFKNLKSD